MTLVYERHHKIGRYETVNRKRFFDRGVNAVSNKRLCIERASDIFLLVKEIESERINPHIHIHISPEFWMAAAFSVDPREYAAMDIQRIFKGWSLRKRIIREKVLTNMFVSMRI
jgi:hypothetical protein